MARGMKTTVIPALVGALFYSLVPSPSHAMDTDVVHGRIISGARLADGRHVAGLELSLSKGWKTYWRSPGESGIAPIFDLSASRNVASFHIEWPKPTLDVTFDMISVVYKDKVILPFVLTPKSPDQDIVLDIHADIGVCETVCIPKSVSASATLAANDTQLEPELAQARTMIIPDARDIGASKATCTLRPVDQDIRLEITYSGLSHAPRTYATVELSDPDLYSFDVTHAAGPQTTISGLIASQTGSPIALARDDITVTVIEDERSFAFAGCWPNYR